MVKFRIMKDKKKKNFVIQESENCSNSETLKVSPIKTF